MDRVLVRNVDTPLNQILPMQSSDLIDLLAFFFSFFIFFLILFFNQDT